MQALGGHLAYDYLLNQPKSPRRLRRSFRLPGAQVAKHAWEKVLQGRETTQKVPEYP